LFAIFRDRTRNRARPPPFTSSSRRRIRLRPRRRGGMLKVIGWAVLIIFIIGLLVVIGVFKAIF
jgi:hypothetical protein